MYIKYSCYSCYSNLNHCQAKLLPTFTSWINLPKINIIFQLTGTHIHRWVLYHPDNRTFDKYCRMLPKPLKIGCIFQNSVPLHLTLAPSLGVGGLRCKDVLQYLDTKVQPRIFPSLEEFCSIATLWKIFCVVSWNIYVVFCFWSKVWINQEVQMVFTFKLVTHSIIRHLTPHRPHITHKNNHFKLE